MWPDGREAGLAGQEEIGGQGRRTNVTRGSAIYALPAQPAYQAFMTVFIGK